jgi:hypothetical protein
VKGGTSIIAAVITAKCSFAKGNTLWAKPDRVTLRGRPYTVHAGRKFAMRPDSCRIYGSIMAGAIALTDRKPGLPDADFAFEIDFVRGEGSASRVFEATADFIRACERLDAELVQSIDANIQPIMMLEDIEVGSIKTWLRNELRSTDDNALKKLDWKQLVGAYLVRAKYAVLRWTDDPEAPRDLPALRREIQQIAAETDIRYLPDYSPPSPGALLDALRDYQGVKDRLITGDRATYVTPGGEVEMNLSIRWAPEDIEALAVAHTLRQPSTELILAVKKPDYLGSSKWDLRHGKRTIQAKIEDEDWLRQFQGRGVDVRPGDALRCSVDIEHEVLQNRYIVIDMFDADDGDRDSQP